MESYNVELNTTTTNMSNKNIINSSLNSLNNSVNNSLNNSINNSSVNNSGGSNSDRKRRRNTRNDNDNDNDINITSDTSDSNLFQMKLNADEELEIAKSIFEIGLKHSSPKVLIALMPFYPNLNTEHIKSHLQKYRIHYSKSKDEFIQYHLNNIKNPYLEWIESKGWEENNNTKESFFKDSTEISDNELASELASDVAHTSSDLLSALSDKADNIINEYHKLFTTVINDNERIQSLLQISALNAEVDSVASKR